MSLPPLATELPPSALAVLARASEHATTHEGRRTIWHRWGDGEPLVLLHGGSGSWTHWIRNVDTLAARSRAVWVPDLPGCGDSDAPASGNDADAVAPAVLAGIGALLGEGTPYDLVGFSFGGLTAGLMAAQAGPTLRRLVLVGAPVLRTLGARGVPLKEWRHLPTQAQQDEVHRFNLAALMLHDPAAIDEDTVRMHAANVRRDRLRRRRLAATGALADALRQVRVPIHAIHGREDAPFLGRMDELRTLLAELPSVRSTEFIEGAGHWVQYEAAGAFHAALGRALDPAGYGDNPPCP